MNKKLIFSIFVVIIAGAGVLGYLEYQKKGEENPSGGSQTTEIDTSDWLTYRNEEANFEIKIPKDWGELSTYDGSWHKLNLLNVHDFIAIGDKENKNAISLNIVVNNKNFNSIDDYISFMLEGYKITKKEILLIENGSGQLVDAFYKDNNKKSEYSFFFFEKSGNIIIEVKSNNELGNKIASTFRFID